MTKTKTTKRALLASAISLLLCFSMLLGTTYAWFTDSVTSAGNIIKSGTLEVGMYWAEGEKAVPAEDSGWKDASTEAIFNYEKWEPGYVQVRHIKIANEGTLALKYKLQIVANGEVSDLADVIDVYYLDPAAQVADRAALNADGVKKLGTLSQVLANIASTDNTATGTLAAETSHNVTLALKMQESAGNQYQDKSIGSTFSVKLLATQVEAEFDSFDDQYDKFADYDGEISGEASLAAAFANGGTYKVIGDVTMTEAISVEAGKEVNLDLDGNTVTGSIELAAGASLTVINGSLESADSSASAIQNNGGELVLEDVEVASARHGVRVEGGEVTINSGTYTVAANGAKLTQHALNVSDGATVNVYDGTFVGPKGTGADSGSAVNVQAGSTVNIYGGSFSGGLNHTLSSKGTLNVYGGTFDQDPSAYLADGYVAVKNGDTYYVAPAGVENVIATADDLLALSGEYINGGYMLAADLDMTGKTMESMVVESAGEVTFYGNGHTISGLTIEPALEFGMRGAGNEVASLFDVSENSGASLTVSDLTVADVTVESSGYAAVIVGYAQSGNDVIVLDNVDVAGATVTAESVAALVGYTVGKVTLTDCDVSDLALTGEAGRPEKVGAFVGTVNQPSCVITTTNCTNSTSYNDYGRLINGATWNGLVGVGTANELATAVANGATNLWLNAGQYDIYGCDGKTLTLSGTESAVLKPMNEGESGCDYGFRGGKVTFNGLTIDTSANTGSYKGYAYMSGTYNNCNFVGGGFATINEGPYEFNECTFNLAGYIWTWGAAAIDFNSCTFEGDSRSILAHGDGATVININNCNFAATEKGYTGSGDWTAIVEIDPNPDTVIYTINFTGENTVSENYSGYTRVKDGTTGHIITGVN